MTNSFARAFLQLLALLTGLTAASFWREHSNILANYPEFLSTKTILGLGVNGANSFTHSPVTLAGASLNLGGWMGHQEVLLDKIWPAFPLISLRVRGEGGSELDLEFRPLPEASSKGSDTVVFRVSNRAEHPSAWLKVDDEGKFSRKQIVHLTLPGDRWARLTLEEKAGKIEASLDGKTVEGVPAPRGPFQILFRGDSTNASLRIKEISIESPGHSYSQSFAGEVPWILFLLVSIGAALLFFFMERLSSPKVTAVVAGSAFLVLCGFFALYRVKLAYRYPLKVDLRGISSHIETREHALERLRGMSPATRPVLLWLGGSQSWGAGASTKEKTTFSRLRKRLSDRNFEWINGAISGARVADQGEVIGIIKAWPKGSLIVLTAGVNDSDNLNFRKDLENTIALARATKARVVLLPESVEHQPYWGTTNAQAELINVARQSGIPFFATQAEFDKRIDDGFLWWDFVHFSDAGTRIAADVLVPFLREEMSRP